MGSMNVAAPTRRPGTVGTTCALGQHVWGGTQDRVLSTGMRGAAAGAAGFLALNMVGYLASPSGEGDSIPFRFSDITHIRDGAGTTDQTTPVRRNDGVRTSR